MDVHTPLWRLKVPNYRIVISRKGVDCEQYFDTYSRSREQLDCTLREILRLDQKTGVWDLVSVQEI